MGRFGMSLTAVLFFFLSLFMGARATYYIDDTNMTLRYSMSAPRAGRSAMPYRMTLANSNENYLSEGNGSHLLVDYNRFYNQEVAVVEGFGYEFCQISIPFTGSGITIFGVRATSLFTGNFTATIDDSPAPLPNLYAPIPALSPTIYNVTLYDLQSLPFGSHVLTINLVDASLSIGGISVIIFDYAIVNDTNPVLSNTASSTASPSASASSSALARPGKPKSKAVIPIAVGTAVGVLVIIGAITFILVFRRRRRMRYAPGLGPKDFSSPHSTATQTPFTPPMSPSTDVHLSVAETEFVHDLYRSNVPAPAVAQVMNRMVAEKQGTGVVTPMAQPSYPQL